MSKRIVTGIMLTVLLIGILMSAYKIQPVKASGTIYIRADGSIDPSTANITSADNVTYYFTDNNYDEIVVERNNTVIDGMDFILQGNGSGNGFYLDSVSNVTIKNTMIRGFYSGIYLRHSASQNIISGNNITDNNWWGIRIESSHNNTIYQNNLSRNNVYGIDVRGRNNSIAFNKITQHDHEGITIWGPNNTLRNNTMIMNRRSFRANGNSVSELINDVDTSNTIDGKPIYYWISRQNMTVPSDAGCVVLVNCSNMIVQNLTITYSGDGVFLAYCRNSTITQNNIIENFYGIFLQSSSNIAVYDNEILDGEFGIEIYNSSKSIYGNKISRNDYGIILISTSNVSVYSNNITRNYGIGIWIWFESSNNLIFENNILDNQYGIQVDHASNNTIWHNNIINNDYQSHIYEPGYVNFWDNGYPSGGNYWSDHNPPDIYSGPYQNETGRDGIGDMPYIIDGNNTDRYPLIYPYGYVPTIDLNNDGFIDIVDIVIVALAFGSKPGDSNWNPYADINQDGIVDIQDIVMIAIHFGEEW